MNISYAPDCDICSECKDHADFVCCEAECGACEGEPTSECCGAPAYSGDEYEITMSDNFFKM